MRELKKRIADALRRCAETRSPAGYPEHDIRVLKQHLDRHPAMPRVDEVLRRHFGPRPF